MSDEQENELGDMYNRIREFAKGRNIQLARGSTPVAVPDDHDAVLFPLLVNRDESRSDVVTLKKRDANGNYIFNPGMRIIDEKHYPSDHDGNVAFMPGTRGKTLQGKAMLGGKITDVSGNGTNHFKSSRLVEDDYEPPQVESCDDVPIDQNPNYRQLNGPGKPKNHIRRGSVSNLFENLFTRATSTSKK